MSNWTEQDVTDYYERQRAGRLMKPTTLNSTISNSPSRSPKRETDNVERIPSIRKLDFMVAVKTVSEANQREHWRVKAGRNKAQQEQVTLAMMNALQRRRIAIPCAVKLTRIGPKALDKDNLAGSLKHCQDAIARKLGVDDGDTAKVTWEYHQMPVGIRDYGVKVEISSV